jgi:hypothetical protein
MAVNEQDLGSVFGLYLAKRHFSAAHSNLEARGEERDGVWRIHEALAPAKPESAACIITAWIL